MNYNKLLDVIGADTDQLVIQMVQRVAKYDYDVRVSPEKHWIWAVPKTPSTHVCMVAHMDTIPRKEFIPYREGTILVNAAKAVLGADDRAGVYAIWELLEVGHRPYVLLTTGEEKMGVGVRDAIKQRALDSMISKIGLFVELDRAGSDDYVYYSDVIPKELHQWAQAYGLHEEYGSYSDVADLTRAYKVAHLNLSIGYKYQHTPSETLDLVHLDAAFLRMCWMLHDNNAPRITLTQNEISAPYVGEYEKMSGAHDGSWFGWLGEQARKTRKDKKNKFSDTYSIASRPWEDDEIPPAQVDVCEYCLGDHAVEDCFVLSEDLLRGSMR